MKGSLGTLSEDGGLYETPQQDPSVLWDKNKVQLEVSPTSEKNEFLTDLSNENTQMRCEDINGESICSVILMFNFPSFINAVTY